MVRLAELTSPAAARLARDPKAVVLLPLGAIEQHGPHSPLLVDWRGEELGYFGWPAAARAKTGRAAMALRGKLIARRLIGALAKGSHS